MAWFGKKEGRNVEEDGREDLSVAIELSDDIVKRGLLYDIELEPREDVFWGDFFLITSWIPGPFMNGGPPDSDEVTRDDLKVISQPGTTEDEARKAMAQQFGRWMWKRRPCLSWN